MSIISHTPDRIASTLRRYVNLAHPEGIDMQSPHHEAGHPDLDGFRVEAAFDAIEVATDRAVREGEFTHQDIVDAGWTPSPEQDALIDELAPRVIGCGCLNEVDYRAVVTNAGAVEVSDGRAAWGMGPTYDRANLAADLAAWAADEWEPDGLDGQVQIPLEDFARTYSATDSTRLDPTTGQPIA